MPTHHSATTWVQKSNSATHPQYRNSSASRRLPGRHATAKSTKPSAPTGPPTSPRSSQLSWPLKRRFWSIPEIRTTFAIGEVARHGPKPSNGQERTNSTRNHTAAGQLLANQRARSRELIIWRSCESLELDTWSHLTKLKELSTCSRCSSPSTFLANCTTCQLKNRNELGG